MNLDKYSVVARNDHMSYEFYSEGPKGLIKKAVVYTRVDWNENVFNLGFGDWDEKTQSLNDRVKTNNNDRDKILANSSGNRFGFYSTKSWRFYICRRLYSIKNAPLPDGNQSLLE